MSITSPLLTDLYQLTMAYGYWQLGMAERPAVFNLFFRRHPFQGNYAVSCGLAEVIEYLNNYQFAQDELEYLQGLTTPQGKSLFPKEFLKYLGALRFECDVLAIPEGELVFAHEPLLQVQGPLAQCQLLETPLVNRLNFATLIASKASRVRLAAQDDLVMEFGLRRAQGVDGALTASRAAYVGGCDAVSNVLAGYRFGIPIQGTMAHSWVMSFAHELEAFSKMAEIMPDNVVLLVDTYDTLSGVQHAIAVEQKLRQQGHHLLAIRLDSGDLNALSRSSRQLLDAAGLQHTKIIASGDLDEYLIAELKRQGAPIDIWGVGTRLVTAYDQPALDAAFKLAAITDASGQWQYTMKRSNQVGKSTNPGFLRVRRYYQNEELVADVLYDQHLGITSMEIQSNRQQDMLVKIFEQGQLIYKQPALSEVRRKCISAVAKFKQRHSGDYPVHGDQRLVELKQDLLERIIKNEITS